MILQNLSWNLLCLASGVPSSKAHWIFSHPGTFVHQLKYLCFLEKNANFVQVYVPCTLIVILSWVGFWLNRYYFLTFEGFPAALFMWTRSLESGNNAKDAKVVD